MLKKRYRIHGSALAVFLSSILLLNACNSIKNDDTTPNPLREEAMEETAQPIIKYGIPVDIFDISSHTIRTNQTLSTIMQHYGIDGKYIQELNAKAKGIFDIRRIKAGNKLKIFTVSDSTQRVEYMAYEDSQIDYILFHFGDELTVTAGQHDIVPMTKISEAEITSSLWEAMLAYNLNPILALDLSDIFAWTVDFFGLDKGDSFKAIYDELYVDDKSVGIGDIHAAWFEHKGEKFYAYRFMQDSIWNYWDQEGNSLRKTFLKAPLRFSRISSGFSYNRYHPVLKIYRPHTGVDYAAPEGTPVVALGDGIVIEKGYNKSAGNYVKIKHNSVYTTGYNHFSRFGKGIAKGIRVQQGQVIGYVGKTGYATGPHLDLRFWKNGKPMDPLKVEAPPVEPIAEENLKAYQQSIKHYSIRLDSISLKPVFPRQNGFANF